jgi:hypothetical protein
VKTTTTQTGAFAMPTFGALAAAGYRERRSTGSVDAVLGSALAATASRAAAWNTVDVPTPVPIRPEGAHG